MNKFRAGAVAHAVNEISALEAGLNMAVASGQGGYALDEDLGVRILKVLGVCLSIFEKDVLPECSDRTVATAKRLTGQLTDNSAMAVALSVLKADIIEALKKRTFIRIEESYSQHVDAPALFGDAVRDAFPSASLDIQEAGNCLAVGCGTATVFHLMRAAEYALRALANDRDVKIPKDVPLELATWEEALRQLEAAETAIGQFKKTIAREAQFSFYHGAMMELRAFKNKFRNAVMHTRDSYDASEASSAFVHVRGFMVILASRITEHSRTPTVWTDAWLTSLKP